MSSFKDRVYSFFTVDDQKKRAVCKVESCKADLAVSSDFCLTLESIPSTS